MNTAPRSSRIGLRVAALATPLVVALAAAPAAMAVPENFSDPEPVSWLEALVVIVAIPVGLALLITLLALAPSMIKGQREQSAADERALAAPQRDADPALEGSRTTSVESGRTTTGSTPSLEK